MSAAEPIAAIFDFWYAPESRARWFDPTPTFDEEMRRALGALHEHAMAGLHDSWRGSAEGCLALCILLDQAPRNMFRGAPDAYAGDAAARTVAAQAIARGFDLAFDEDERRLFFYLPFEHSEALADQERCVALQRERIRDPNYRRSVERHHDIIRRFGRFPHRNAILGRPSTPEEIAFLSEPFSSF